MSVGIQQFDQLCKAKGQHSDGSAKLAVRLSAFTRMMRERQTQFEVKADILKKEIITMGATLNKSVRYVKPVGVTSAWEVPATAIPEDIWKQIVGGIPRKSHNTTNQNSLRSAF